VKISIAAETSLDECVQIITKMEPKYALLRAKIVEHGGRQIVPPCGWVDGQLTISTDPELDALVDHGQLMVGPVVCRSTGMENNRCHQNVSRLWRMKRRRDSLIGIGTGYCFSDDDGLWRSHSWGVRKDGLLETLGERSKYFGIVMVGIDADVFTCQMLFNDKRHWNLFPPEMIEAVRAEVERCIAAKPVTAE
jgi:hypothetical protein